MALLLFVALFYNSLESVPERRRNNSSYSNTPAKIHRVVANGSWAMMTITEASTINGTTHYPMGSGDKVAKEGCDCTNVVS